MEMVDHVNDREYIDLNERIDKNIDKLEASIMQIKKNKYQRDVDDYEKGEVYTYQKFCKMRTP